MPRVNTQTRSTRGRAKHCGRCGREIKPGERYFSYSFRYGGTQVRCSEHYPKQSELTQSKLSELYSAIEGAEEEMASAETVDDIVTAVGSVEEVARDLASEYEEAAEAFGGAGENAERAEMLESYADELSNFSPDEAEAEVDCEECEGTGEVHVTCDTCKGSGEYKYSTCEACEGVGQVPVRCETCEGQGTLENSAGLSEAIEEARSEAQDLMNEMPF